MLKRLQVGVGILLLIVGVSATSWAQDGFKQTIRGQVADIGGLPLANVSVGTDEEHRTGLTDEKGRFTLYPISAGRHTITLSHIGYRLTTFEINLTEDVELAITLHKATTALSEVVVTGQSNVQAADNQIITAKVVDIAALSSRPATLTEVINRASGVRIRENGGLGDRADISINGFQGRSVRYFKDGIPLDYLGDGYHISNLPLNSLQRLEVYKGVLPVSLGADALGGAVNLVTNDASHQPGLNLSYEAGSFRTHRATAIGHNTDKDKKWFAGGEAFYNYSKNNYNVSVRVPDPDTRVPSWQKIWLYHNAYRSYYAEGYIGLLHRKWADEVRLSIAAYDIDKEVQHPTLMNTPYGAIRLQQNSVVPTLRYKKSFANHRIRIDQFVAYNTITKNRTDTLRGSYDWYGHFTPDPNKLGESPQPALSDVHFYYLTSRTNISAELHRRHTVEANITVTNVRRKGRDPYGLRFTNTDTDILSVPATYFKIVAGLGWEYKIVEDKLTNNLIVKSFGYRSKGIAGFRTSASGLSDIQATSGNSAGIADGVRYRLNQNHLLRLSAEYTSRLPDQEELFGNSDTRVPNFALRPERSFNINLNHRYQTSRLKIETSVLFRKTKDMILLIPVQPPYAQYQNLENVRGFGVDVDVNQRIGKHYSLSGNVTWLNNRMIDIDLPVNKWQEGTRLRNTPFFFCNAGFDGDFDRVFRRKDHLKFYVYYNFIREFYLDFIPKAMEPKGFLGLWGTSGVDITTKIPDQHLLSAGVNYQFAEIPVQLGFEIKNITDANLYDFYRVQKPGRGISLKINYSIF